MSSRATSALRASIVVFLICGAFGASANTLTWFGGSGNWSTPSNWSPAGTPASNDLLIFPNTNAGLPQTTNNDVAPISATVVRITSTSGSYTFTGNGLITPTIDGSTSSVTHTWNINTLGDGSIDFSGTFNGAMTPSTLVTVRPAPGGNLVFAGVIGGSGGVQILPRAGTRVIMLAGNTYTGGTTVQGATEVNGSIAGNVSVQADRLSGTGSPANVAINPGAVLAPGQNNGNNVGTLSMSSLGMNGQYDIQLANDTTYDKTNTNSHSIGIGSLLTTSLVPPARFSTGVQLTIINDLGGGGPNGSFNGLGEGAQFVVGDNKFSISYAGGTGNDVVLTVVAPARHWTGGGTSNNWSDPGNWAEGAPPASGMRVIFPPTSPRMSTIQDLSSLTLDSILVQGPYSIGDTSTGVGFGLFNGFDATAPVNVSVQVSAVGSATWNLAGGTFSNTIDIGTNVLTMNLSGNVSMATSTIFGIGGNLNVQGGNELLVANVQPTVNVSGGSVVRLDISGGNLQHGVFVTGGSLQGQGSVSENLQVINGSVSPGTTSTGGIISTFGPTSISIGASGTYDATITGAAPGAYDVLDLTVGGVSLSGNLTVTMPYAATPGQTFEIINNRDSQAIIGTFAGKPEGSTFLAGSQRLRISYVGDTGNDVVLTRVTNPLIASVIPSTGPTSGGFIVTLNGSDFVSGLTINVGGVPAGINSVTPTQVQFTAPVGATSGPKTILLTNPDGVQTTATFTYNSPVISGVSPTSGIVGASVTINGVNFNGVDTVQFGGVNASFTVNSFTQITATVPAGTFGSAPIVVFSNGFSSNAAPFTRLSSPVITGISPLNGSTSGGYTVTLMGTDFVPGATITVGGTSATILPGVPPNISFTAPSKPSGPATVVLTNPDGQTASTTFTYDSPSIGGISPSSATVGTTVTINGASFDFVNSVTFGGVSASFTILNSMQISATVPGIPPGGTTVVVAAGANTASFPFTRLSSPTITNTSPANGTTAGGTTVTLTGTSEFIPTPTPTVTVGGTLASVTSATTTQIVFITPAGTSGPTMIVVTNNDGQTASAAFTYDAPSLSTIAPSSALPGATVTLTGTSLNSVSSVTFGGLPASFTILSPTQIQATVPALMPGATVSVVVQSGPSTSAPVSFTVLSNPSIGSISPASGPTAGGYSVTLNGAQFLPSPTVTVGGSAATVTAASASSITFTAPAHASGPVSVVVTNSDGQSASTTFTYASPGIANISPASGAIGATVTINGQNLNGVNSVTFGGVSATISSTSATQLQVIVPNIPPGPASVVATSNGFPSNSMTFTRIANPTITNVSPPSGPTSGGITVTLTGTEFLPGATVTVGGVSGSAPTVTATTLSFTLPAGPSGPAAVVVTNPDGSSASTTFTYNAPSIAGFSPTSAPVGATITINGSSLSSVNSVTFNGVSATFTVVSATQIQATVPALPPGNASVVVSSGAFSSAPATFAVTCPALNTTVTASGPTTFCTGGSVTLTAPAGYSAYAWSNGATSQSITVNTSGSYTVTVTGANSCTATSAPTVVTVNPSVTVTITGPTSACAGETITLTASGANINTYLWSNGATSQSINVIANAPTTTLTVTGTSAAGCSSSATHTINVSTAANLIVDAPAIVDSGASATASVQPVSGANSYMWTINNGTIDSGQGTPSIAFTAGTSGSVTLTVVTSTGVCSPAGSATISIRACATTPASLLGPVPGAAVTSPVTFAWSEVPGAVSYDVYAGVGNSEPILIGTTTSATLNTPVASGSVNWFVVTRLPLSCSPSALQSATRAFTVVQATSCPQTAPVIVSPAGGTKVFSPITLRWQEVLGATGYNVFVQTAAGGIQDLGIVGPGITSVTVDLPPGSFSWSVSALYSGCPAAPSASANFTVDREDCSKHGAPSLIAPANASTTTSTINFAWTAVQGADGYRVWVANTTFGEQPRALGETADTKFTATLEPGTISWFVEALFEGCASTNSPTQTFIVPAANNCARNVAPTLIGPADGITTNDATVTFAWSDTGALEYEVYLSVNSGTPALLTKTKSTSFTAQVPQGDLEFFVRAAYSGCPSLTSGSRRFRYQPAVTCSTERPILISPLNETTPIPSPVTFRWSAVAGATQYRLTVVAADGIHTFNTSATELVTPVASGPGAWSVTALFNGCSPNESATAQFVVVATAAGCIDLVQPIIAAPSQISHNVRYFVQWQPVPGATGYELQRSTSGVFNSSSGTIVNDTQAPFVDTNTTADVTTIFYRVRALSTRCTPTSSGPYSAIVGVGILPAVQSAATTSEGSTLASQSQIITYSIPLGSELAGNAFTATPTAPWIKVTPASGVVPANGTLLSVIADTTGLPVGTSAGNVLLSFGSSSTSRQTSHATTAVTVPVSVNKVTPVTPNPKSAPPPDALIIPAVAHADGINAKFESDVRITNTSAQVIKYQLTFTPTGEAGISDGRQAVVDIEPGRTMALDDVLKTWFGTGSVSALGTLEIRPLTKTASSTSSAAVKGLQNFSTFASSRTFNLTQGGTFGQYIPAIPFANFVGRTSDSKAAVLSLQQIAQSPQFRTNLGLVEGSGDPATVTVSVFAKNGQKLTDFDVALNGGQHLQMGSILAQKNLVVDDGRIEVRVTSPGGKVTAYASVLDNKTNDSLLVNPISLTDAGNTKYVLPGVAELSAGIPWRTDVRLFNASDEAVTATLTLQPLNGTTPITTDIQLAAKEVRQLDRVLSSLFGVTNDGGALHIATTKAVNLIATARTYRPTADGGSFGQFISAVTPNEAVALGSRPLQLLQVEESPRYRSNIGLAEVTGNPATVEVTAIPPDSKASVTVRVPMAANQFRQLNSLLAQMGLSDTHNARVTVRVIEGTGRVTAYASVIDAQTADPTYVPAQ